jgi:hypothetical protein
MMSWTFPNWKGRNDLSHKKTVSFGAKNLKAIDIYECASVPKPKNIEAFFHLQIK